MCREGSTENAVGASTNDRNTIPPTQTIRERNIKKRRMDIGKQFSVVSSQFSARLIDQLKNSRQG
jgi:hypothetical protein